MECPTRCCDGLPSRSSRPRSPERGWDWERFSSGPSPSDSGATSCSSPRPATGPRRRWNCRSTCHDRKRMPQSDDALLVLIVDDDETFRGRLRRAFVQRNWEGEAVPSGDEALKFARDCSPDLVLVDLRMPAKNGLDVVQELRALDSSMTIIMLTGYGSIPTAI